MILSIIASGGVPRCSCTSNSIFRNSRCCICGIVNLNPFLLKNTVVDRIAVRLFAPLKDCAQARPPKRYADFMMSFSSESDSSPARRTSSKTSFNLDWDAAMNSGCSGCRSFHSSMILRFISMINSGSMYLICNCHL